MARVRDGDVEPLALLFDRHNRPLFRFFLHLCGSAPVAEDLVQEVFFRILKFRGTYREDVREGRFTAWMYQIARNVHTDHLRKKQSEMPIAGEHTGREPADPAGPADLRLIKASDVALLRRALARLPADRRELLVLCRYQNLPYEQVAEILQCETGAVKTRVFRAMRQLSEIFMSLSGRRAS